MTGDVLMKVCLGYKRNPLLSSSAFRIFAILHAEVYPSRATVEGTFRFMISKNAVILLPILLVGMLHAQNADPQLLAEINKIKAIDNHSHPPKVVAPGEKDDDFDALPCDPLEPTEPTTVSRPENPQ